MKVNKRKKLKHTPGKWHLRPYAGHKSKHNDWPGAIVADNGTKIYAGPFSFRSLQGASPKEAAANAKLIAAAPGLLAVCEQIEPAISTLMDELGKGPAVDWGLVNNILCDASAVLNGLGATPVKQKKAAKR